MNRGIFRIHQSWLQNNVADRRDDTAKLLLPVFAKVVPYRVEMLWEGMVLEVRALSELFKADTPMNKYDYPNHLAFLKLNPMLEPQEVAFEYANLHSCEMRLEKHGNGFSHVWKVEGKEYRVSDGWRCLETRF